MRRVLLAGCLIFAATGSVRAETVFANGYNCPRGLKFVAGACVTQCPGGYEDTGTRCEYRRMGGGGGK